MQINQGMSKYKPEYLGCIAANEIGTLKPTTKRVCWVMNTDPRSKPGSHWVCFFMDLRPEGSHSVEYYDPLADPISPDVIADLKRFIKQIYPANEYLKFRENKITDQNDTSSNCGQFCVNFLQRRLKGRNVC